MSLNTNNPNPNLRDLLELWKRNVMLSLNCHAIGTIESFNNENQTVSASINYPRTYYKKSTDSAESESGFYKPVTVNYPVLVDMPIVILSGGNSRLTFPIAKGDQCLILFNDRSIDQWFQNGQKATLELNRLHSFSDGIALIGLRSLVSAIDDYDTARAVLKNTNAQIAVGANKIEISNATRDLKTLLQDLITAIKAITVSGVTIGGGTSGVPVNIASFTSISAQIGELLE